MELWTPNKTEKKHMELIVSMSIDCILGKGTDNLDTYLTNLRQIADILSESVLIHTHDPPEDKYSDCEDCQGTGIGHSREPRSCGRCKGRGYNINPHYLCPDSKKG